MCPLQGGGGYPGFQATWAQMRQAQEQQQQQAQLAHAQQQQQAQQQQHQAQAQQQQQQQPQAGSAAADLSRMRSLAAEAAGMAQQYASAGGSNAGFGSAAAVNNGTGNNAHAGQIGDATQNGGLPRAPTPTTMVAESNAAPTEGGGGNGGSLEDDGCGGCVPTQRERRAQALTKYKQKRKVRTHKSPQISPGEVVSREQYRNFAPLVCSSHYEDAY